ncbi:MAG: hypothetical protein K2O29_01955 [Ruminococcus sp.]|nr:hypothetical protein [Ruminococcus sp.]MDE6848930.1 hypothetical protein [Ruminococcus sp.]MDE7137212.1 hypothetical protein [Ruminococcus sp.]
MKIEEALQRFADDKEECVIYIEGGMIIARVLEIGDGFIVVDEKDSESVINIDHIIRVRTYPKNEKGKRKAIF